MALASPIMPSPTTLSPVSLLAYPSPVESNSTNSTDTTEIDEDSQEIARSQQTPISSSSITHADALGLATLAKLDTRVSEALKTEVETGPRSVIHAPAEFKIFRSPTSMQPEAKVVQSPSEQSDNTVVAPNTPSHKPPLEPKRTDSLTSPLNTDIPLAKVIDRSTPRAQTVQEAEEEWMHKGPSKSDLADIPEMCDADKASEQYEQPPAEDAIVLRARDEQNAQIDALRAALRECWTLCNSLAGLSTTHRERIFNYRGKSEVQEQAWRSCWRLCQNLYDSRDEDHAEHVIPTLYMCRDFCQALFDARQRNDESADSVLRVSFELNNHLYNIHDPKISNAFQERTLDFYLTLCHRLMKQRTSLPHETDALLRAGWSLAEMLFSIRQNNRDGKPADEELLGSAIQACWELCDLFREGWTQVRPDRGTPRPSQTAFSQTSGRSQSSSFSARSSPSLTRSDMSSHSYQNLKGFPPETPTTIFDDTNDPIESPEDNNIPNILVLGPDHSNHGSTHHNRWISSASSHSGLSETSQQTSSTATASSPASHLSRVRVLLVKAAINAGFQMQRTSPTMGNSLSSSVLKQQNQALLDFVKNMPSKSFGMQAWQMSTAEKYRKLVAQWPAIARQGNSVTGSNKAHQSGTSTATLLIPETPRRITAADIARAVHWMMRNEKYSWIRDLYRVVFGSSPEDGLSLTGMIVQG